MDILGISIYIYICIYIYINIVYMSTGLGGWLLRLAAADLAYEGSFTMQRHAPLAETDGRITSPTP